MNAILRARDVTALTGLHRSTIWRRIQDGSFPESVRLGGPESRAIGWLRSDIESWLNSLAPAAGRKAAA